MIQATVDRYIGHLETNRRVTDASLRNYRSTCTAFATWAANNNRGLDSESIQDFVGLYDHAPTANVKLVRLTGLAKFAEVPIKLTRAKEEIKEVVALSSDEVNDLIAAAFEIGDDMGHATRFLAETGLRFDEFMRARTCDVKRQKGVRFLQVNGKGRKFRKVPLTEAAFESLQSLDPERGAYFEKKFRRSLTEAGELADLDAKVHPHLLRASFISILLNEKGAEAIHVAQIVGHGSVDTMLQHYAQVDMTKLGGILGR